MTSEIILRAMLVGLGATLVLDLWALARRRFFGVPSLDYALVGRWLGHMGQGRVRHAAIGKAPVVRGERLLGWGCHYLIGVLFAGAMLVAVGPQWLCRPSLLPALLLGLLSVAAPLLLMQPAFGMGLAASRLPNPWQVRLRSLLSHLVFGLGIYLVGWGAAQLPATSLCAV
ncbi:DUF2938 domain-containing protein [Pseudomonas lalucatii]|uniref:DUF2938 domain-containing protein n=1 Tax=Pseudomonas lalucatii TaxID=1424203 RepID=A0ABS5Q346_9PSED|nr:DUF2938 domain-containing protein [Pseudomonas lalucatii]MBS7663172.1 DUF2938 domain-containing protein [Pseudomonas lalucatii]MBS7689983.1 DUF2938 domain-containing protein [Pseudomonas lalucatii]MBS7724865.1 DUF2938 domain-containing protein [Pseudomonas lalucatii]QVM87160.1 DUF2938 domain-containing protein [Pseudomonas lalucatii]